MTRLDLDAQPEAVRELLLGLAASAGGGVVLDSAGRAVGLILPQPTGAAGEWTADLDRRRCALMTTQYDAGLTPAEGGELALLQDACNRHVDRLAPPGLGETRELVRD